MQNANVIEMVGAVFAGLITVAIVAVLFKPGSTAPAFLGAMGSAFSQSVNAASGGGQGSLQAK